MNSLKCCGKIMKAFSERDAVIHFQCMHCGKIRTKYALIDLEGWKNER
jgi:hypothetical protein